METRVFDGLSRSLAISGSRRMVLRAFAGAGLAAFLRPRRSAAVGSPSCASDGGCAEGEICVNDSGAACGYDASGCPEGADVCTQIPTECTNASGAMGMCFTWNGVSTCAGDGPAFACALDEAGDQACSAEYGTAEYPWWICARGPTCQTGCYPLLPEACVCSAPESTDFPDTGIGSTGGTSAAGLTLVAAAAAVAARLMRPRTEI